MSDDPLLMIPGPTPVSAAVRAALAEPVRSHISAENAASAGRIARALRDCFGSTSARVHIIPGSGTLAMEIALLNAARPGDRVVVCSQGFFGDRFVEIARALGLRADVVTAPWGERVEPEELARVCAAGPAPAVVTVTHVDTASGVLADAQGLAAAAAPSGALLVLDGVCATAAVAEEMDAWGYDCVLTGAQKALGVPPGLALLAVSDRYRERRAALGTVAGYYGDLARWDPAAEDPTRYFSTQATSLVRALDVALAEVLAEGLPARFARHRRVADAFREGAGGLGLRPLTRPEALAPTLSVLEAPADVDAAAVRLAMLERGVAVAGGLGPWAGRALRVGHMGTAGQEEVTRTLEVMAAALDEVRTRP